MFRIAKYLKPFMVLILIAIVLLFVQAMADLSLPDYMSEIVNVGIQQGGIKDAVPVAVRQSQMGKLTIFIDKDSKDLVFKSYALIDKSSPDYEKYLKDYPVLENEQVYVLNNIDKDIEAKLNTIMGRAFLAVYGIEQMIANPSKAAAIGDISGFDLSKIPAGATPDQIFGMFAKLPSGQFSQIQDSINK
ncbi:MAG: ABC transporter ATP-binding protein, partial [Candidatus Humimicrobiaceae bacterium]